MRNNIVFKFIAIILCAASLLGAVGGIVGVAVLTEGDLYNKTVEQVKEERIRQNAENYASTLALMYASSELGGCPERMVTGDGFNMLEYQFSNYGYRILDAEGNVLSSYNEELKDTASLYTFSPTGQYMHLVSVESQSEIDARNAQAQIDAYTYDYGDGSEVPAEGVTIDHVEFYDGDGAILYEATRYDGSTFSSITYSPDGSGYSHLQSASHAGFLFYNTNGKLVYQSFLTDSFVDFNEAEVSGIYCVSDNGFLYDLHAPEGLGMIFGSTDSLRFVSYFTLTETAEETEPATEPTIVETIPETTAAVIEETVTPTEEVMAPVDENGNPIETAAPAEETTAETAETEETITETVPSSASAVPEETAAAEAPAETEAVEYTEYIEETQWVEEVTEPAIVETLPPETIPEETVPETTQPVIINGKPLSEYQVNQTEYYDPDTREQMSAKYVYVPMPELTVELYVDKDSMRDTSAYALLALVRQYRGYLLPSVGICLLIFAIFAVYLCTAAGRKPKTEEVRAGGLNRLPLDLYLFGAGIAAALCIVYGVEALWYLIDQNLLVGCATAVGLFFLASLVFVGFSFAFVAQLKTPGGFWWRNTLCGHFFRLFMRFAVWLETWLSTKGFPGLGRAIKKLWQFTCKAIVWTYHAFENSILWIGEKLGRAFRWIGGKLHRFLSLLPLTWQWLVVGFFVIIVLLIGVDGFKDGSDMALPIALILTMAVVVYVSHCFGILAESTKGMSKGDLDTKVDDKMLVGCFKDFAEDLNDLAGVAVVAAQKQLKSERMKTELITNVSHDIKTPLTSIINYVDLLQKPHTDEEEQQYLEVLDRQSQRLKKLIDDLMDMSKANTGNMQVDITQVDAVESVNQALGEFADKLDKAQLIPVFRHDDARVHMLADGRLVWRVLSNLLSNAVKYAMPGTRLYIDLMTTEGKVILSLKNISREELNVDADELMERFVRGDDSRNTEGSGLGLNIAKSLMELQRGQLQLLVDGDLFKVTLIFPGA